MAEIRNFEPGKVIRCDLCDTTFKFPGTYKRHMRVKHKDIVPILWEDETKKESCICDICGQAFTRRDSLLNHKKYVHEGLARRQRSTNKIFTCEVCGASFMRKNGLEEHYLIKHTEGASLSHQCTKCPQSFSRKRMLENHINREHLGITPYECATCKKQFSCKYYRNRHLVLKSCTAPTSTNGKFKCSTCGQRFRSKDCLEMHLTAKHYGGAYRCVCGMVLQWQSSVAKHKRRCKMYKDYVETLGERAPESTFNVIEVSLKRNKLALSDAEMKKNQENVDGNVKNERNIQECESGIVENDSLGKIPALKESEISDSLPVTEKVANAKNRRKAAVPRKSRIYISVPVDENLEKLDVSREIEIPVAKDLGKPVAKDLGKPDVCKKSKISKSVQVDKNLGKRKSEIYKSVQVAKNLGKADTSRESEISEINPVDENCEKLDVSRKSEMTESVLIGENLEKPDVSSKSEISESLPVSKNCGKQAVKRVKGGSDSVTVEENLQKPDIYGDSEIPVNQDLGTKDVFKENEISTSLPVDEQSDISGENENNKHVAVVVQKSGTVQISDVTVLKEH